MTGQQRLILLACMCCVCLLFLAVGGSLGWYYYEGGLATTSPAPLPTASQTPSLAPDLSPSPTTAPSTATNTGSSLASGAVTPAPTPSASAQAGTPASSGAKPTTGPVSYSRYLNYDLGGTDVAQPNAAGNVACASACGSTPGCTYFVMDAAEGSCWLKAAPTTFVQYGNRTAYAPASVTNWAPSDRLLAGNWLYQDGSNFQAYLQSQNGLYRLFLQSDANLSLTNTKTGKVCWASGTSGKGSLPYRLQCQFDGNVPLYTAAQNNGATTGPSTWASNTVGKVPIGQAYLLVGNDGTLSINGPSGSVWSTNTAGC